MTDLRTLVDQLVAEATKAYQFNPSAYTHATVTLARMTLEHLKREETKTTEKEAA